MNTEERFRAIHAAANDGPNRDVQIHPPGTWDGPDSVLWMAWCGSMFARGATLDAALDGLLAELRANGGCWICQENYGP